MELLRPNRAVLRPERADLRPGREDGWMDRQTNGWTNKSPPVFYRTSSPSGPLPKKQLVIQGSHMVSSTRSRPKVEHRGEFRDVLRRHISGLRLLIKVIEGRFKGWRADFSPGEQIQGLEDRFETQRTGSIAFWTYLGNCALHICSKL